MVERESARVRQRGDKWLHAEIRGDLIKRNRNALAARSAESDVGVSLGVYSGIRDGVQVVGDLQTNGNRERLAFLRAGADANRTAARGFRNAHYDTLRAGKRNAGLCFSESYKGPREAATDKAAAANFHLAAGNRRSG